MEVARRHLEHERVIRVSGLDAGPRRWSRHFGQDDSCAPEWSRLSLQQDDIGALLNTLEDELACIRRHIEIADLEVG